MKYFIVHKNKLPFSILYHYLVFSASISIDVTIILPCLNEEKTLLKSYDVKSIPRFNTELKNGYDVIIGNRFKGKIEDGAMSLSHRIGSRFLTRYANLLFHTPINDFHCGLRAFNRKKLLDTGIKSPGFEFASEMIIRAKTNKLRLKEIETNLFKDGRCRKPHLRTIRDGFRHLHEINSLKFSL